MSSHPHTMKWSIATSFVRKVLTLSDQIFMRQNIESIHTMLSKNNYPPNMIKKAIQIYRSTRASRIIDSTNEPKAKRKYASVHYVPIILSYQKILQVHCQCCSATKEYNSISVTHFSNPMTIQKCEQKYVASSDSELHKIVLLSRTNCILESRKHLQKPFYYEKLFTCHGTCCPIQNY